MNTKLHIEGESLFKKTKRVLDNWSELYNIHRERSERAELALLKIGMATNERKTYEAVAAFFNVKVGQLWTLAKKRGVA